MSIGNGLVFTIYFFFFVLLQGLGECGQLKDMVPHVD